MKEYRFIGDHAETLEGGRPIEPGEYTGLIDMEGQNNVLLQDGLLIEVPKGSASAREETLTGDALSERARELDIQGRSSMSAGELREAIAERETNTNPENDE